MFFSKNKDNFEAILSSIEAIIGRRYIQSDDDDSDLVSEFMKEVFDAGLRAFRKGLCEGGDYLPKMEWRMSRLRLELPWYKAEGKAPSMEKMMDYLHGIHNGLCCRPRRDPRRLQ